MPERKRPKLPLSDLKLAQNMADSSGAKNLRRVVRPHGESDASEKIQPTTLADASAHSTKTAKLQYARVRSYTEPNDKRHLHGFGKFPTPILTLEEHSLDVVLSGATLDRSGLGRSDLQIGQIVVVRYEYRDGAPVVLEVLPESYLDTEEVEPNDSDDGTSGVVSNRKLVRSFLEVARTGSFLSAAMGSHTTVDEVVSSIQSLERQVGASLFTPNNEGVRLTEEGQRLLALAERAEQKRDYALDIAFERQPAWRLDELGRLTPIVSDNLTGSEVSGNYTRNALYLFELENQFHFADACKSYLLKCGISEDVASRVAALLPAFLREEGFVISATPAREQDRAEKNETGAESNVTPATLSLPEKAPALWKKGREADQSPTDFIKRHYAPWLGKGLVRAHIAQLDPPLYAALNVWLSRHPAEAKQLNLPKQKERTDALIGDVFEGDTVKVGLLSSEPADRAKAIRRLSENLRYREKKSPKNR